MDGDILNADTIDLSRYHKFWWETYDPNHIVPGQSWDRSEYNPKIKEKENHELMCVVKDDLKAHVGKSILFFGTFHIICECRGSDHGAKDIRFGESFDKDLFMQFIQKAKDHGIHQINAFLHDDFDYITLTLPE